MKTGVIAIVLVLISAGGGYFFYQNQGLQKQVSTLKDEKTGIEKELAVLKSTDLAKDNEILKLKLKSAEDALALEKKNHSDTGSKLAVAENRIKTLESNLRKLKPYVAILEAFNDWQYKFNGRHLLDRDTSRIDSAISALGDASLSSLWSRVKAKFPQGKETGVFGYDEVILLVTSRISDLLK